MVVPFKVVRRSQWRTVLLALLAAVSFIVAAIWVFEVEAQLMLQLGVITVLGLLMIIVAALLFTLLWQLLRRCMGSHNADTKDQD